MIDALAYIISEETKLPVSAVKKVLRALPQVTLQRALEGNKTIIPGLVTIYPESKTLKARLSRHLKEKYRLAKKRQTEKVLTGVTNPPNIEKQVENT